MDRLRREPVPADELSDAKSYLIGTFPYSLQALDGLAGRLEDLTLHPALPPDTFQTWPAEVEAVEPETVLRAAERHLHPLDVTIVAVGPAREIAPQLSGLGSVEVVPTVPS
jgi:predicted Zn-dependent peptidase